MNSLFIFGLGYTAQRIASAVRAMGWEVSGTGSSGGFSFDDASSVRLALAQATHILSSVPPLVDGDPVLNAYEAAVAASPARWRGYLSSTGVYGDSGGAWVDENAPIKGRRISRNEADQDWLSLGAHVFRLPGIYGPGRSALDRVREGKAHRIDLPDQIFSRIHVDDIVAAVIASFDAPPGAYNIADDFPCGQNAVIESAAALLEVEAPPLLPIDESALSPLARAFYSENRRVANGKTKRVLGWQPQYPTYVVGLRALREVDHSIIGLTQ
jgi:nucleoside-diphosphate-sugar epimerase